MTTIYTHKNVEIAFDENKARFTATIDGKPASTPSLAAMKAKIDKARVASFERFTALKFPNHYRYDSGVEELDVEGIAPARRGYSEVSFACVNEADHHSIERVLVPNTEEGREAIKNYLAIAKELRETQERLQDKLNKAHEKIPVLRIADYLSGSRV